MQRSGITSSQKMAQSRWRGCSRGAHQTHTGMEEAWERAESPPLSRAPCCCLSLEHHSTSRDRAGVLALAWWPYDLWPWSSSCLCKVETSHPPQTVCRTKSSLCPCAVVVTAPSHRHGTCGPQASAYLAVRRYQDPRGTCQVKEQAERLQAVRFLLGDVLERVKLGVRCKAMDVGCKRREG